MRPRSMWLRSGERAQSRNGPGVSDEGLAICADLLLYRRAKFFRRSQTCSQWYVTDVRRRRRP